MKIKHIFLFFLLLSLWNCTSTKSVDQANEKAVSESNAVHQPDIQNWVGQYTGTLPCADCSGIETELVLLPDQRYELKETYLGKEEGSHEQKGSFIWLKDQKAITLKLDGKKSAEYQFLVKNGTLEKMDINGAEIKGVLKDQYVLKKMMKVKPLLKNDEKIIWINSSLKDCMGVIPMKCMQIQEGETPNDGQWEFFYDQIEGFEFKPGFMSKLLVKVEKRDHVPADASSLKYTLLRILDQIPDKDGSLQGVWKVSSVYGKKIEASDYWNVPTITLNPKDNTLSANDGCNSIGGGIDKVDKKNLVFDDKMRTSLMACEKSVERLKEALTNTKTYKIERGTLYFYNAKGEEVAVFN